jgi:HAD superfamily hydrolase (TIGR01549 family)
MKTYENILFDWDGCLAQTLSLWLEAYKAVFAEYDVYPRDREITEKVLGDWQGPGELGVKDIVGFGKELIKRVGQKYPKVELYDHAYEVLEILKMRGKKLALLTTSNRATLELALENTEVKKYFEVILTGDDVKRHKPDSEMIDKALVSLGGSRETSVIIGDSKHDLGAANNAKIDSILFYPKNHEPFYDLENLKLFHPTHIISNLGRLTEILI